MQSVGTGIPDEPDYPQTIANRTASVRTGIPSNPHYPQTDANGTQYGGTGIPPAAQYPHTDANHANRVVMEISDKPDYPQTVANQHESVGVKIAGGPQYFHTDANGTQYVGMGIPSAAQYSQTYATYVTTIGVERDDTGYSTIAIDSNAAVVMPADWLYPLVGRGAKRRKKEIRFPYFVRLAGWGVERKKTRFRPHGLSGGSSFELGWEASYYSLADCGLLLITSTFSTVSSSTISPEASLALSSLTMSACIFSSILTLNQNTSRLRTMSTSGM